MPWIWRQDSFVISVSDLGVFSAPETEAAVVMNRTSAKIEMIKNCFWRFARILKRSNLFEVGKGKRLISDQVIFAASWLNSIKKVLDSQILK